MNIQEGFNKIVALLANNSESLDVAECLEEMKCGEVFFSKMYKLNKEQFLQVYPSRAEFAAIKGLKKLSEQIVALIESFEQSKADGIYYATTTTEDKSYLIFVDEGLQILHAIVTSPLTFAEKEKLNQAILAKGLKVDSYVFLNGSVQE